MRVSFVTPLAALFALSVALPLTIFAARRRRLRAIRTALGLAEPTGRSQLSLVLALAAIPALLGLAAAQPVIETTRTVPERTDAQVFVVVDVSRSMLASAKPGAATRFDRARSVALGLREPFPEVPFGLASLISGVLPHLFPTTDGRVYAATLAAPVNASHPPPAPSFLTVATNLNGLHSIPELDYFPPSARKRVVVVLTDGESPPPDDELARAFRRRPRIETVFVRFWDADERIYESGVAEGGYRPDPASDDVLARVASAVGGEVFAEDDVASAVSAVRAAVGDGQTVAREQDSGRLALMPYLALLTFVPIAYVLLRRNVWSTLRRPARPPLRRRRPEPAVERRYALLRSTTS